MFDVPEPAIPDYYADLGVPAYATPREIKAAWFRLAKQSHPDKMAPGETIDAQEFRRVGGIPLLRSLL